MDTIIQYGRARCIQIAVLSIIALKDARHFAILGASVACLSALFLGQSATPVFSEAQIKGAGIGRAFQILGILAAGICAAVFVMLQSRPLAGKPQ